MATEHARHLKAGGLLLALAASLWFTGCAADKKKDSDSGGNDGDNGVVAVKFKAHGAMYFWVHEDTYNDLLVADQTAIEAALKTSFDAAFTGATWTFKVMTPGFTTPFTAPTVPPDYTPVPTATAPVPAPCTLEKDQYGNAVKLFDGSKCMTAVFTLLEGTVGCSDNNYKRLINYEQGCIAPTPAPTAVAQLVTPAPTPLPGQPGGAPTPKPTVIAPTMDPTPHPTTPFPTPSACEHSTSTGTYQSLEVYYGVEGPEAKPKTVPASSGPYPKTYEWPGLSPSGYPAFIDVTKWNTRHLSNFLTYTSSGSDSNRDAMWAKVLASDHSIPQHRMVPHLADALSDLTNRTNSSDFFCTPSVDIWTSSSSDPPIAALNMKDLYLRVTKTQFLGTHEMCDKFAVMAKGCTYG